MYPTSNLHMSSLDIGDLFDSSSMKRNIQIMLLILNILSL